MSLSLETAVSSFSLDGATSSLRRMAERYMGRARSASVAGVKALMGLRRSRMRRISEKSR